VSRRNPRDRSLTPPASKSTAALLVSCRVTSRLHNSTRTDFFVALPPEPVSILLQKHRFHAWWRSFEFLSRSHLICQNLWVNNGLCVPVRANCFPYFLATGDFIHFRHMRGYLDKKIHFKSLKSLCMVF
jgi:hypothetical protein